MKTLRFHEYGEPADVLRLEDTAVPSPGAGQIRVQVHACGLNPADWYLCQDCFPAILRVASAWIWPEPSKRWARR